MYYNNVLIIKIISSKNCSVFFFLQQCKKHMCQSLVVANKLLISIGLRIPGRQDKEPNQSLQKLCPHCPALVGSRKGLRLTYISRIACFTIKQKWISI